MPPHSPRKTAAQRKAREAAENSRLDKLQKAVTGLADGTYTTIPEAYETLNIPETTLRRALKNGLPKKQHERQESNYRLIREEEIELVDAVKEMGRYGFGMSRGEIREMAQDFLSLRGIRKMLGKNWVDRFLKRWDGEIVMKNEKIFDPRRAAMSRTEIIDDFFGKVRYLSAHKFFFLC